MSEFTAPDGVRLALDVAGDGPAMVFQHGLCGDAGQPAQVFPDIGWQRLTLECRGHGASDAGPLNRLSIASFTDDLAAMITARRLRRPVVGGISMGAAMALRLAVTRPDLVGALVLARPAWGVDAAPVNMQPNALVGQLLADHPADKARAVFEASEMAAHLTATAPDNLASLRGFFARQPIAVTSALLTRISADGPGVTAADLAALRLPVLVIGHERDHVHPLALAEALAAMIPGAQLATITPKATNPLAYRAEFQAALAQFLKGLPHETAA
jgi:pimeloyl-ACP methyl ester carboxylesterase